MANGKAGTTSEKGSRATPPKPARPAAEAPAPARRFRDPLGIPVKALYYRGRSPARRRAAIGPPRPVSVYRAVSTGDVPHAPLDDAASRGFGTAEHTNQRFHYLLAQGMTGLSTASTCRR